MDHIWRSWLQETGAEAQALAEASDILDLQQLDLNRYIAHFACRTLACEPGGEPYETVGVQIGYFFSPQYLRQTDPQTLITVLQPTQIYHPNGLGPFLCIGAVAPGTPLIQLLYRTYEVVGYGNYTSIEHDSLNAQACSWARRNQHRFPLESLPLKRRNHQGGAIEMEAL